MSLWADHKNNVRTTESGIRIEDVRNDAPEFRRVYTAHLDDRADIEIEAKTWLGFGRHYSGTLMQPNGSRVWFEVERIADRILDRTLVPLVERAVAEILQIDRAFVKSDPREYTDKHGSVWRRA